MIAGDPALAAAARRRAYLIEEVADRRAQIARMERRVEIGEQTGGDSQSALLRNRLPALRATLARLEAELDATSDPSCSPVHGGSDEAPGAATGGPAGAVSGGSAAGPAPGAS